MDARTLTRIGSYLLVAALATGCTPLRSRPLIPLNPSGAGDPTFAPNTGETAPAEAIPGGTVVAAGGTSAPQTPIPTVPTQPPSGPPGAPIAAPRPLPAVPNWPGSAEFQPPPGSQPLTAPNGGKPHLPHHDPHVRLGPTASGGRLGLAPHEMSTDRVVELTLHLERLLAQNRDLAARIIELEAAGAGREQALAEAAREVEAIAADAAKTRAALQGQITTLQGKIKQLEEEDIIFLKAVIEALGRLLPPEKKP